MGDRAKQAEAYESDQYRFGAVDDVKDLERERGVGPNIAAHERSRLLENADSVGYFEIQGGSKGGLGAPLHLGDEIKKDGAPAVAQYEAVYNSYAHPLRKTYRAMGRLKDLSMTNAPLTPSELEKTPKLMAHFQNLKLSGPQDAELSKWSQAQSSMVTNIKRFGAGQHLLAAAMANYSRVQKGLEAKRRKAQKSSKLAEIAEIDQAVQRVHKVINTVTEAWTLAGSLDDIIGSASLDATDVHADGGVGVGAGGSQPANPNWVHGTADDPSGGNTSVATKKQKAAGAAGTLMAGTAEAQQIVAELKAKITAGQEFDISIDGVLTAVMGGKKGSPPGLVGGGNAWNAS